SLVIHGFPTSWQVLMVRRNTIYTRRSFLFSIRIVSITGLLRNPFKSAQSAVHDISLSYRVPTGMNYVACG
ncbi:MAG: hypothetical protein ACOY94_08335, partial [Bacillota bacterium]